MSSTIIDETVILRYLLDDEVLSPRAAKVIATRTARVYPEIITRVVVTLRDVYKVPRVEIAAAMKRLLDDVMVDEPTVVALAVKLFGKTHMDFTDCLLAARTAIYNDDVVSFGKPIIQGMIDYRRKRQTAAETRDRAAEARSRSTDSTIDKLRHRPRS
jgi:predicted nucleic-acid-binding protein